MLSFILHSCSNCLGTKRFLHLGETYACETCNKRLWRLRPLEHRTAHPYSMTFTRGRKPRVSA